MAPLEICLHRRHLSSTKNKKGGEGSYYCMQGKINITDNVIGEMEVNSSCSHFWKGRLSIPSYITPFAFNLYQVQILGKGSRILLHSAMSSFHHLLMLSIPSTPCARPFRFVGDEALEQQEAGKATGRRSCAAAPSVLSRDGAHDGLHAQGMRPATGAAEAAFIGVWLVAFLSFFFFFSKN